MSSIGAFLGKFGGLVTGEEAAAELSPLSANAPNAFGAFMDQFSTMTDSYWFYDHSIELKRDSRNHKYYRVEELGNLTPVQGTTDALHIIGKSHALIGWAVKKGAEKLLRTIPLAPDMLSLAPITLADFTKLVMEAKDAHKEILTDAGDIGHLAHKCLEDSIQHAIDHTEGVVIELRNLPTDQKALAAAQAAFAWMQAHNVRWRKTEHMVYSREFEYAGTMDGEALVDSCVDPSCCTEQFKDSLSVVDWKSSNALHVEYILQAAGAYHHAEVEEYGEAFQNCFVLRLGKNAEEAGAFEPWRIPSTLFPKAFEGFLLCLKLVKLLEGLRAWVSTQKKGVREVKKKIAAENKEIAKMKAKVLKEAARAQKKLERAAERERIKADAKKTREEAKLAKQRGKGTDTNSSESSGRGRAGVAEHTREESVRQSHAEAQPIPERARDKNTDNQVEEEFIQRKPLVIPEEE